MIMNIKAQRILIVRTDRIGDVVLTTPAIAALRKRVPDGYIAVLVSASTADLVKGNPHLDEVLIDDRAGKNRGFWGFFRLVGELKKMRFDAVINFHTKKRTNLACFLAGIPKRIGYQNEKFGFLLTDPLPDERPLGIKHEAQYCLDVLGVLGITGERIEMYVPVPDLSRAWVEEMFRKHQWDHVRPLIAIHSGSSCPTKKWPVEYFSELMSMLDRKYHGGFVLLGGKDNVETALELMKRCGVKNVFDLTGQISLAQLAAVLERCDLLVSNDSGPVHIAAALNTRVVSIFTRNQPGINPERWRPLGKRSAFVAPSLDMTVSFTDGKVDDPKYLYRITPQEVMTAVDAIF